MGLWNAHSVEAVFRSPTPLSAFSSEIGGDAGSSQGGGADA